MELCLRPGGWLSALARLFAAEDPAPQSRAQARPEVNARAEKLLEALYGDFMTPPPENLRHEHYPHVLDFGPYADV